MKKLLLIQPNLYYPGGGNTVAVWILEALKSDYALSVLTWAPVSLEHINTFYGTSLKKSDLRVYCLPSIIRRLVELDPDPNSIQGECILMRLGKIMTKKFNVVIMAQGEADLGGRSIQYIHYPWYGHLYRKLNPAERNTRTHLNALLTYLRPWRIISGFSFERMKNNLTLVNSNWIGLRVMDDYGIPSITVNPPVAGKFPDVPWEERENGFVCIGRISPEKRYGSIIDILADVRKTGEDVHLHIIGAMGKKRFDREYYKKIRERVVRNASWVYLHENIERSKLIDLITRHKYGVHRMEDEPFGIAIAEMIHGCCIVFAAKFAGPPEIVGEEEQLLFTSNEEAVAKILQVIRQKDLQNGMRRHLDDRKELYSVERFMNQILHIVRDFMQKGIE